MLSTKHGIEIIDTGKKNRSYVPILKPKIIIDYNSGKAGMTYPINYQVIVLRYVNQYDGTIKWPLKFY